MFRNFLSDIIHADLMDLYKKLEVFSWVKMLCLCHIFKLNFTEFI